MKIERVESVTSTIDIAKSHPLSEELTLISAKRQYAGRGRNNRSWSSPSGNLYLSFVSPLPSGFKEIPSAAHILSLTLAELLESLGLSPKIKWPNDLLLDGSKVGGVLAEVIAEGERLKLINSCGLNVNMEEILFEGEATSLFLKTGQAFDLQELETKLYLFYRKNLQLFVSQGFTPFISAFSERLTTQRGDPVRCHIQGQVIEGTFHTLKQNGALLIELPNKEQRTLYSMD